MSDNDDNGRAVTDAISEWEPGKWYASSDWAGCERFSSTTASARGWGGLVHLAKIGVIEVAPVFPGWVNSKYRLLSKI